MGSQSSNSQSVFLAIPDVVQFRNTPDANYILGINLPLYVLIVAMVLWAVYAVTTFWIVTRALRKKAVIGLPTMIGGRGKAVSPLAPEGQVIIKGELWGAKSIDEDIDTGDGVVVVGQDGLKLIVRRVESKLPITE